MASSQASSSLSFLVHYTRCDIPHATKYTSGKIRRSLCGLFSVRGGERIKKESKGGLEPVN